MTWQGGPRVAARRVFAVAQLAFAAVWGVRRGVAERVRRGAAGRIFAAVWSVRRVMAGRIFAAVWSVRRVMGGRALATAMVAVAIGLAGCTSAEPDPAPTPTPAASTAEPTVPPASPTPSPSGVAESPQASATSQAPRPPRITSPPTAMNCTGSAPMDRAQAGGTGPLGTVRTTGSAKVALTFDDGPDPVNTPKVLDLLRQCGVKATFCVNGTKAQANPTLIRRIHSDGHTFCNHTWNHITPLGDYGPDLIRQDLSDTNNAIRAIVPDARVSYFRAPGGRWTADYLSVCQELGMTPTHWDVDTRDWESSRWGKGESMVNHIISVVQGETRPGSIVLMHDYQKPDTTTALRTLLPWLKARFTLDALPATGMA